MMFYSVSNKQLVMGKWNSALLTFSFITEGASKKVLQILMPMETINNKNFCFNEQKCLLCTLP